MTDNHKECIIERNKLDNELQHQKYYFEGYKEQMLLLIKGENYICDKLKIDMARYSPDSIRAFSYNEGIKAANSDYVA